MKGGMVIVYDTQSCIVYCVNKDGICTNESEENDHLLYMILYSREQGWFGIRLNSFVVPPGNNYIGSVGS